MTRTAKKLLGLCIGVLLVVTLFTGCGTGIERQTAGELQRAVDVMKSGDIRAWRSLPGSADLSGAEAEYFIRLMQILLRNVDITCTLKESDVSTAVVAVRGKTGNLSSVTQKVFEEVSEEGKPWMQGYTDRGTKPTQQELMEKFEELVMENFEEYAGRMEVEQVDVEIVMKRKEDGQWWIGKENEEAMQFLLFGSTDLQNDPGLRNLSLNLNFNFYD